MKISILKKADYSTWKVNMLMYLKSIDDSYVEITNDGPPYPTKVVAITPTVPEHYIRKENFEWSDVEKAAMLKDSKVRNILHNSLDNVMSNRVIACKSAKPIWDALETQCQGTLAIMKNRRVVLVPEYEQFDVKSDETIANIYDRFLTLLNDLSLVGKKYDKEDSNTKFLIALSKE
ncbi:uncharacterized protein LOC141715103 [Apium graveolens]|uniref:uncharacterized protein LOC141715103 n=1 Tax=Apium graveolens TaxID=4045 RepID=UPI003D79E70F